VMYTDTISISGNGTYSTTDAAGDNPGGWLPTGAGSFFWSASYSGDGNNNPYTSPASEEPVTVEKVPFTLQKWPTTVYDSHGNIVAIADGNPGTITLGTTIHDTTAPSGLPGLPQTGTVEYDFYNVPDPVYGVDVPIDTLQVTINGDGSVPNDHDLTPMP